MHLALVRFFQPGDNFEQGGFSGAIGADQPRALAFEQAEGNGGEQRVGGESLGQAGEGDENLRSHRHGVYTTNDRTGREGWRDQGIFVLCRITIIPWL